MNIDILPDYIILNEGIRLSMYLDSLGIKTIGVGFNLERPDANTRISALGLNFNDIKNGSSALSRDQAIKLLEEDIDIAVAATYSIFGDLSALSDERKIVLFDMAFNLGQTRLTRFVKLISAVKKCNWNSAAREMKNSDWAKQVGRRADYNIYIMKNNRLPNNHLLNDSNNSINPNETLFNKIINFFR
jgi:lysozyme